MHEFYEVHRAKEILKIYEENPDINLIHVIPYDISRFDVWACVFEKHKRVLVALKSRELSELVQFVINQPDEIQWSYLSNNLFSIFLLNLFDSNCKEYSLTVVEALNIIKALDRDWKDRFIAIYENLDKLHKTRIEITSKYVDQDSSKEWTNMPKIIMNQIFPNKKEESTP